MSLLLVLYGVEMKFEKLANEEEELLAVMWWQLLPDLWEWRIYGRGGVECSDIKTAPK